MKLRDRPSTATVIDDWLKAADAEFGLGATTASLRRLTPTVRSVLESSGPATTQLADFGHSLAQDNHELGVALRSLELLADASREGTEAELSSRSAVVHITNGWTAGVLNRNDPVNDSLTPFPFFTHLVQQRYASADRRSTPAGNRVVLVVVDIQHLIGNRLELARVRGAVVRHLRQVFTCGEPVSEGANGNLVVMVDRGPLLLDDVARARRAIHGDPTLAQHPLRVWIEPLADDEIHLESHLGGLLGDLASH